MTMRSQACLGIPDLDKRGIKNAEGVNTEYRRRMRDVSYKCLITSGKSFARTCAYFSGNYELTMTKAMQAPCYGLLKS